MGKRRPTYPPTNGQACPARSQALAINALNSRRGMGLKPSRRKCPLSRLASLNMKPHFVQVSAKRDETDFGRVRLPREHRFDDERLADRDPIKSAGELAVMVPHFDRMGVAGFVQGLIGVDDVGSDPGEMRAPGTRLGARPDHRAKGGIEGHVVIA